MIRVNSAFKIDSSRKFPNELLLIATCPNCWKNVNLIEYICLQIPRILKYIPTNKKKNIGIEINVKCPLCEYSFIIDSATYK